LDLYWYGNLSYRCQGIAKNIKVGDQRVNLPDLVGVASISDKRVRNVPLGVNGMNYRATNGQIPRIENVRMPKTSSDFVTVPHDLRKARMVFGGLIGVLIIVPLGIWLRKIFLEAQKEK